MVSHSHCRRNGRTYSITFKAKRTSFSLSTESQRVRWGKTQWIWIYTKLRARNQIKTYSGSHSSWDTRDTLKDKTRTMMKTPADAVVQGHRCGEKSYLQRRNCFCKINFTLSAHTWTAHNTHMQKNWIVSVIIPDTASQEKLWCVLNVMCITQATHRSSWRPLRTRDWCHFSSFHIDRLRDSTHISINKLSFPFIFLFNGVNIRCTAPGGPATPGCPWRPVGPEGPAMPRSPFCPSRPWKTFHITSLCKNNALWEAQLN